MKWINYNEFAPGKDCYRIIVKGKTELELKTKYYYGDIHKDTDFIYPTIFVMFYDINLSFKYHYNADYKMKDDIIYDIQPVDYLQNLPTFNSILTYQRHIDHYKKIGINSWDIIDFVDKRSFKYSNYDIEYWMKLENNDDDFYKSLL